MAQVTWVPLPFCGWRVNSAVLWASKGIWKSSLISTRSFGSLSVICMRPTPTSLLPCQEYAAPTPSFGPL
ncbi:hypothetical protein D3C84_978320 [compost metagenome]